MRELIVLPVDGFGMRIAAIGVGGTGGRVVDALYRDEQARSVSYLAGGAVLDTDQEALDMLESVPADARHLFGQVETNGAGTGGDRALGAELADADRIEMRRAVDEILSSETTAIMLVAGLGGGTGAGATPVLAAALDEVYDQPMYTVSVLPASHEEVPDGIPARGLQELDSVVDAQIVFDNDTWVAPGDDFSTVANEVNTELADRLGALFSAGEAETTDTVGERVVDASEIIATLEERGLATIGYASQRVREDQRSDSSLVDRVRDVFRSTDESVDEVEAINAVETTLRRAANGRLTFDAPLDAARSGLLVISGPPRWLNQAAVAKGQRWLSEEIGSVQLRTGDDPKPQCTDISILVLLAGIQHAPRIESLRQTNR